MQPLFHKTILKFRFFLFSLSLSRLFFLLYIIRIVNRDYYYRVKDTVVGRLQLGNTLIFLFNLIGRNPEVQETLYKEAQSLAPPGCDLTVDDLRKAKYLRACITESFRCSHIN